MKTIPLSNNRGEAIVDDADFEALNRWRWRPHPDGYAQRKGPGRRTVLMHRQIMGEPSGMQVDHINGNGLDNRRCNLRIASHWQNLHNCSKQKNNTSGFKGVFRGSHGKWRAIIQVKGTVYRLGSFATREEAADAYDRAALRMVGEFARINGPRNPAPGSVNGR